MSPKHLNGSPEIDKARTHVCVFHVARWIEILQASSGEMLKDLSLEDSEPAGAVFVTFGAGFCVTNGSIPGEVGEFFKSVPTAAKGKT